MYGRRFTIVVLIACLVESAPAADMTHIWPVRALAASDLDMVELRDEKGRLLKRVSSTQIRYLYAATQAIRKVAEIHAEPLIVDGAAPNAFATKGRLMLPPEGEDGAQTAADDAQSDRRAASVQGTPITNDQPLDEENSIEVNLIAFNFGMLDMLGLDVHMMAALIGHELAHLKLNHGEDVESRRGAVQLGNAASTRYSRDNEREADYLGAIWSVEAGFDPEGAVRLQEMVYKASRSHSGMFVGSHPTSTERIAILKSLARRLSSQKTF
jgi:Zn-dependent protease with chaperone function